jgi:hypothetical protein
MSTCTATSRVLRPATEAAIAVANGGRRGDGNGLVGGPAFETPPEVTGAAGMRGAFPLVGLVQVEFS